MTSRRGFIAGVAGLLASAALPDTAPAAARSIRRFVVRPAMYAEGDLLVAVVWSRDGAPVAGAPEGWTYVPGCQDDGKAISFSVRSVG